MIRPPIVSVTILSGIFVFSLSCGLKIPDGRPGQTSAGVAVSSGRSLKTASSGSSDFGLGAMKAKGFLAESSVDAMVDTGDASVKISDRAVMNLLPGGDFCFKRAREHTGASDGPSVETMAAVQIDGDWFVAGSSGQWVRWDDAFTQPDNMIDAFVDGEERLLSVVRQCALTAPDGKGRLAVTGFRDECRFRGQDSNEPGTRTVGEIKGEWGGRLRQLSGHVLSTGDVITGVELDIDFVSGLDSVPASVKLKYVLAVKPGGDPKGVKAPAEFLESRRPRPVRMAGSVLSGLAGDWGAGAPDILKKSP